MLALTKKTLPKLHLCVQTVSRNVVCANSIIELFRVNYMVLTIFYSELHGGSYNYYRIVYGKVHCCYSIKF